MQNLKFLEEIKLLDMETQNIHKASPFKPHETSSLQKAETKFSILTNICGQQEKILWSPQSLAIQDF